VTRTSPCHRQGLVRGSDRGPNPEESVWGRRGAHHDAYFEAISSAVIDPGQHVFERINLGAVGPDTVLGGYSIVEAVDLEGAVELATKCPALYQGGGVEVGLLADLASTTPEKLRQRAVTA
jgi:hypothetical protein